MNIKIKRIDKSLPLPEYETKGSVAFDIYSRIDDDIKAGETKLFPSNLIIETPPGYMLMLSARSSLAKKKGLKLANGIGIIDQDYCGPEDEFSLLLHNYSNEDVHIERGERLGQGTFVRIDTGEWEEVDEIRHESRGGFGSTGEKVNLEESAQEKVHITLNQAENQSVPVSYPNPSKGKLIVIDGIDGTGKATQANFLLKHLQQEGHDVATADFPKYGDKSAGLVENYLNGKYGSADEVNPSIASLFYMMDRYDASFDMRKQLENGKIIISNRYVSANMGHQGSKFDSKEKRKSFFEWLDTYEHEVLNIPRPDLTIILHVPPSIAQKLVDKKADRAYIDGARRDIHENDVNHLQRASETYLQMCEMFHNYELIECMQDNQLLSIEKIGELVWEKVNKII